MFSRFVPPSGSYAESASFFKHGHILMDQKSHADFIARSTYDFCRYSINQVTSQLGLKIDPAKFLASFSYEDEETGERRSVSDWEMAVPTSSEGTVPDSIAEFHEKRRKEWETHYVSTAGLLPSAFMRNEKLRKARPESRPSDT